MRARVITVAMAVLLSGCGGGDAPDSTTTEDVPDDAAVEDASDGVAVEGVWQSDPLTEGDVRGTLAAAGLEEHWDEFVAVVAEDGIDLRADPGMVIRLTVEADQWNAYYVFGDGPQEILDTGGTYTVDGDTIIHRHPNEDTTFRWSVDGDQLAFDFVSVTDVEYSGMPIEVFVRAWYTSVPFRAVES